MLASPGTWIWVVDKYTVHVSCGLTYNVKKSVKKLKLLEQQEKMRNNFVLFSTLTGSNDI